MRNKCRTKILLALIALCLQFGLVQFIRAQNPKPQAGRGGFMQMKVDPRVQMRSYLFKDGDISQNLEYAVFVSSKASKDKKNPLIVTLHGLGVGPSIMFGSKALELAEEGGYILVGPMGFNVRGWYGISMKGFAPPKLPNPASLDQTVVAPAPKPKPSMFSDPNDPPNLNELSEKDVMNVLDMVRKEFNIDDRRIYLMGHSMGGAGTLYLGVKYSSIWAALGPIAPAAFTLIPDSSEVDSLYADNLCPWRCRRNGSCCQHSEMDRQA